MRLSTYLSDEEVAILESMKKEGETLPQALKRLAFTNNQAPSTTKEYMKQFYLSAQWVMDKYKQGKILE